MFLTVNRIWCATAVALALTLTQTCDAVQLFGNTTVPANVSAACSDALLGDISCSPVVTALRTGSYYDESLLTSACTATCADSLATYKTSIDAACAGQTWNGYLDTPMPLVMIADMLQYLFNLTCLTDSGRYCKLVAAQAALAFGPASSGDTGLALNTIGANSTNSTNPCDLCFIKTLRFQASSPYFDGPLLADQSIYESKTSSCQVTGYPLTTYDLTFFTPTATPTVTPTPCAGTTYTIQATDDCHSISISQSISTAWLLLDNQLEASCAQFPTSGNLCLVNTCKVYSLQTNDTCTSVALASNITVSQFKAWNPTINAGCYNLGEMAGDQFCVSAPGRAYVTPTVTILAPLTASTPAPVPTDIAADTNTICGRYYTALPGDYCNMIVIKFGISLTDFVFLNPAINANCTNLFAFESYCVEAVGDINTYSGRPGFSTPTPTPTGAQTMVIFSEFPDATYITPASTSTAIPLAQGTRADCNHYFEGGLFQKSTDGTNWVSPCDLAAAVYNVDLADFGTWNVGLGNVSLANCTFSSGVRYCGRLYFGKQPPPVAPASTLPIRNGTSPNCTQFTDVTDGWKCQDVLTAYDLTLAQFYSYNPVVLSDCSGLWIDYQYCVRTPGYVDLAATTTAGVTPSTTTGLPQPTSPVQSGQPTNCNKWYTAQAGDSCASIENVYFIKDTDFHTWNPAVSADCTSGFWAGYAYCVGTTDTTLTRSSTIASSTTTSSTPVPSPTQPNNAVSNCNKYAQVAAGDTCWDFADRNGITLTQLFEWNSVLGQSGDGCSSSFWAGYYYCAGVQ